MALGLTKTYLIVAILFLGILSAFSFSVLMGMETDRHGQMAACPFTLSSSICTMGFSEHLSMWQSMFAATLNHRVLFAVVGLIILLVLFAFRYFNTVQDQRFKAFKLYTDEHSNNPIFNKLLELFSGGILNSKIYELVIL